MNGPERLIEALHTSFAAGNGCFAAFSAADPDHDNSTPKEDGGDISHCTPWRRTSTCSFLREQWILATQELVRSEDHHHHTFTAHEDTNVDRPAQLVNRWWDRLWTLHTSLERHYHTSVHLEEMLHYLQLCCCSCRHCDTFELSFLDDHGLMTLVRLAIFFHDAIYDATSSINEQESASLFTEFADQVGMDADSKQCVVNFILATQTHALPPPCNQGDDNDTTGDATARAALMLFLDLDMAVLAKDEAAYDQYAACIRNEYHFVPHDEYCAKRADILQIFVQRPCIYYTPILAQAWQARARLNLHREIALLRRKCIPGEKMP
jgi:predicted metal-dependent HD superfamily phosphohydrolase